MPQNDILRRYTEAGLSLTRLTRARAQEIAKELVRTGEIQREQAQRWVDELVDRSRKSTEDLLDLVRGEVHKQVSQLRLVSRDDVQKLVDRFASGNGIGQRLGRKPSTTPRAGAQAAKGSAATKKAAPAKRPAAKKATAKKAAVKKRPAAKKATAKKY